MEFNGAALVANKKIKTALNVYYMYKSSNDRRVRLLKQQARQLVDNMHPIKKWLYENNNYKEDMLIGIFISKYMGMFDGFADGFLKAGIICRKEYKAISYSVPPSFADELSSLVACGEPVYLNPKQASFVNLWSKK